MSSVAVIDYGASNLRSVSKALEFVAGSSDRILVSQDAKEILAADRIVFPGQGAIGQCMQSLRTLGLDELVRECIATKPFLGICLGLQSLMQNSEEDGGTQGLGIVAGSVRKFSTKASDEQRNVYKIPHMGWNRVRQSKPHTLWNGIEDLSRFYFVHSYFVEPENKEDIAGSTDYIVEFAAAVARENVFATQFHPEKSQHAGLQLLTNFLAWKP